MAYESDALRDARIDVGAVFGAVVRRLPRIIVVTLLLLALTFAALMFMPRLYESSASILVEQRANLLRSPNEPVPSMSGDAGLVSSQIELLKSRDTLMKVIDELDLRAVPEFNGSDAGPSPQALIARVLGRQPAPASIDETVLASLLNRMTVIQERDSRIISVLVRSTDPGLAARIANAVANAHVARRTALSLSDTAEASGWLRTEIDKLRVAVGEAESAVANFKVDNDLFTGANNTSLVDQQLSSIASQLNAAQERRSTALSRAQLIRGLIERGQSIEGVPDVRDSTVIQRLSEEKARLQGERAQRSATLLNNHPSIQALVAQIAELDSQISIEGRSVADALEAEAQIEEALEASLREQLTSAKGSASTATQDTVTLDGLQREAKAQRDLLESYLLRYTEAISRTDSNSALPDVRVVTLAAPSIVPASPKTALILMAVGIVALAGQIGLVVFGELMSGRAIVASRNDFSDNDAVSEPEPAWDEPLRAQDELEVAPFIADEQEPDPSWQEPLVAEAAPETASVDEERIEPEADQPDSAVTELDPAAPVADDALYVAPAVEAEWDDDADHEDQRVDEAAGTLDDVRENFFSMLHQSGLEDDTPAQMPSAAINQDPDWLRAAQAAFADLAADLALGRSRVVILAGHGTNQDCELLAEALAADALDKGLSVALVDAGSAYPTEELGLSDLSSGAASFGDVVHKSLDNAFAEVPWGQGAVIDPRSTKPLTLIEALGDIYEVVIVMTGVVDEASTLPLFAPLEGRLVLVAGERANRREFEGVREQLDEAGFGLAEVVASPELVAA
ncbi:hypothetical protein VW29_07415 [Devosia limi DSM 17137]|uniref:Uncharacterized protein involved in exopolysaccharide biosynthesis n=1 Tax=Devosia limi DSM 17137 TaxID=1121477 RepID=A0A0F5LU32_9HYPH|nr:GumC family protein [Devosia limi]KKB85157.1 hypothetical protein VW29_07415 [Devosia limi DSM 17137]SHF77154.1 Uncharacterized protein involved in exopolysaccharide biosynthesis [Devosia limi DSM 17137]